MEIITKIGASLVVTGLLFFIFHNAIKTANFKRRAVYFLVYGLIFMAGFGFGIYKDYKDGLLIRITIDYLLLPMTILLFTIIFISVNFINAKRYHHHFRNYKSLVNKSSLEYLYIIYKYDNNYILDFDKEYKGIIIRFDHNVYFHDEMVNKYVNKNSVDILNKHFCGVVNTTLKNKKATYYCYEIELKSINPELGQYKSINKYEMHKINADPFHKNIIFRMLINEQFNINE